MAQSDVAGGVVKVTELVGSSTESFSDAVRRAVKAASKSIRNIRGVEVISSTADVGATANCLSTRSTSRSPSWWRGRTSSERSRPGGLDVVSRGYVPNAKGGRHVLPGISPPSV